MPEPSIMTALMGVIRDGKNRPPSEPSYVVDLMKGGVARIGGKIVEEAAEVVEAGDEPGDAGRTHLVNEVADLVFHTAVLLGYRASIGARSRPSWQGDSGSAGLPRNNRGRSYRDRLRTRSIQYVDNRESYPFLRSGTARAWRRSAVGDALDCPGCDVGSL